MRGRWAGSDPRLAHRFFLWPSAGVSAVSFLSSCASCSYAPGAVVSEVARRHDMSPQHLFGWRKAARAGLLTLPADEVPMFVPIVREARDDGVAAAVGVTVSGVITIEIAGAVVRAERGVDLGWLRDVLRAVKAAT